MKLIYYIFITCFLITANFAQDAHLDGKSGATELTKSVDGTSGATEISYQKVVILWTTDNSEVFDKVVYPYALNSKKFNWWDEVNLIVWGPSAKLLSENKNLQQKITELAKTGVIISACKWCSDQYKVSQKLAELNIDVKYMGKTLTEFLKSESKVITF